METNKVFYVFDTLTKSIIKSYVSRNKSRESAERLNQQYGCVRYVARIKPISFIRVLSARNGHKKQEYGK